MKQELNINFLDSQEKVSWFSSYETLQEEAPVYFMASLGMYVVTRYEDLKYILSNPKLFTVGTAATGASLYKTPEAHAIYKEKGWQRYQPLSENEPKHSSYRKLIDPFMTAQAVQKREPYIRATANQLIDRWIDAGEVEFIKEYAELLPMMVIAEIMGFPKMDIPQLQNWSFAWALPYTRGLTPEKEVWAASQHVEMQRYIYDTMQEKRKNPKDDLISNVLQSEYIDPTTGKARPLTDEEAIGIFDNCLVGGNETTAFAISNGLTLLLKYPEIRKELEADRKKIIRFVEETLRVESPVHGLQRVAEEDVELHGVKIPKGSVVHVRYGAANVDPRQFPCPHMVDLGRKNSNRHMAFSQGEHFCPGAALSRLEQKCTWEIIFDRLSNIREAPGKNDHTQLPGAIFRSLKEFHIQFDKLG